MSLNGIGRLLDGLKAAGVSAKEAAKVMKQMDDAFGVIDPIVIGPIAVPKEIVAPPIGETVSTNSLCEDCGNRVSDLGSGYDVGHDGLCGYFAALKEDLAEINKREVERLSKAEAKQAVERLRARRRREERERLARAREAARLGPISRGVLDR